MENITEKHEDLDFLSSHHSAILAQSKEDKGIPAENKEEEDISFLLSAASENDILLDFSDNPIIEESFVAQEEAEDDTNEDTVQLNELSFSMQGDDFSTEPLLDIQPEKDVTPADELPGFSLPNREIDRLPVVPQAEKNSFSTVDGFELQKESTQPIPKETSVTWWRRFLNWFQNSMGGPTSIGIDTSVSGTKTVHVRSTTGKLVLSGVENISFQYDDIIENEESTEQARLTKLAEFLTPKIKDGDWLVGGITGLDVIYRVLELPKMNKKELGEAVRWAVRKDLPFEVENAELDYQILSSKKKGAIEKYEIAVLVTPKNVVENSMRFFQLLHTTPAKLTSTPVAIWSVLSRMKATTDECILVLEIGASSTHMVFVNKGHADFHREIPTACNEMIEAISNTFFYSSEFENISGERTIDILDEFGILRAEEIAQFDSELPLRDIQINLRPVIDRLMKEIRRSLDYYRSKYKIAHVARIFISGGGALIKNLDSYMQSELQMDVAVLNPFVAAGIRNWENFPKLKKEAPKYTIPLGLAIDNFAGLNLLPEELKGAHTLRKAKRIVRWAGAFLLLVLSLYASYIVIQKSQLRENIQQLQQQYKRLEPVRKKYLDLSNRIDVLKKQITSYNFGGSIESHAANHLRAVSHLVTRGVALSSIVVEPEIIITEGEDAQEVESGNEKITLSGIARPDQAREGLNLADFLLNLESAGYFQDIKMINRTMRDDGTIEFVIQCLY